MTFLPNSLKFWSPVGSLCRSPLVLLVLSPLLVLSQAATITMDDQDQRILYSSQSSWQTINGGNVFDFGGSHMLASNASSYAEVNITFITFQFLSALYPYPITTNILLDGELLQTIDLRDYGSPLNDTGPATVPSAIVFSHIGTSEREHSIRIAVPGNDSAGVAIVDALMFGVTSTLTTSPVPTNSSPLPTPSPPPSDNGRKNPAQKLKIIFGVIFPIIALLAAFLAWFICRRDRILEWCRDHESYLTSMGAQQERLQPDIPDCQTTLCVARSREKAEEESTEESGPVIFPEAPVGGVPSPIVDSQVLDSSSSRRQSTGALQLALTPAPSQTESTSPILTSTIETTL